MPNLEKLYQMIMEANPRFSIYWARKTAEYLLASGVVVLPCKVGDTVWIKGEKFPAEIEYIKHTEDGIYLGYVEFDRGPETTEVWADGEFMLDDIGKTVFLTREEADKALKKMDGGDNNG